MATLALGLAGQAIGSALLPGGVSLFGATLSGAAIGGAIGTVAGAFVDSALFGSSGQATPQEGPRLSDLKVSASTEGTPIPRLYGRMRVPGQLIWATRLEEEAVTVTATSGGSSGGGKGFFGGGGSGGGESRTEFRYFANLAYAVAEGEISRVGRIWADGKELDQAQYTIRVHTGSETQEADSLLEAKEGAGNAPAYRGAAYVVFERMPVARFGNRLPQLNFEVFRAVDQFEESVKAVNLIPATGEFAYDTTAMIRVEDGVTTSENLHTSHGGTDWTVSLDQLEQQLPEVGAVSLIVAWFGDDLRVGECALRPGVEVAAKTTQPESWGVAGVGRGAAHLVSQFAGGPAFGGTPSDAGVVRAIQDLKARGLEVIFYPFILMDVPPANTLPDPYSDNAGEQGQPAYPWRGRITVSPAPGFDGSPDQTAGAKTQADAFVGTAAPEDFAIEGETVVYSGPAEWTLRRMILHYAHLCEAAGGVDGFIIASELRGATWTRDGASSYPFVAALADLAADVKAVLTAGTKVTYAADWSEYFGHQPADGSGDVHFHLDPLWASDDIDAVGIDVYWPLSDWRDGAAHLDAVAGAESIYDLDYLKGNITAGEGFDFFYASQADRDDQTRTAITDGAGKPWVFRFKDIKSWWQSQHFDRPGGVESGTPTDWVPESKPYWFTELGCPAVDKGANQPNVFHDPKSSESFFPYFSRGTRDDLIQRRYLQAIHGWYDPAHPDYVAGSNPTSSVYAEPMLPLDRIFVYTWDARPWPAFPYALDVWSDGGNWDKGHWLTGRMAGGPLGGMVAQLLDDYGFTRYAAGGLTGAMDGYLIDRVMSARAALQPLELAFFFDSYESAGLVQFAHRGRIGSLATLEPEDLVAASEDRGEPFTLTRAQETELPVSAKLTYVESNVDYRQAAVEARRLAVRSERVSTADLPIAIGQAQAQAIAESWLQDAWAAREKASFALPPSLLALEPTDMVTLDIGGRQYPLRIVETAEAGARAVEALTIEPDLYQAVGTPIRVKPLPQPPVFGPAVAAFLDLPLMSGAESPHAGWVAAYQSPWPGAVAFYRSPEASGFVLNKLAIAPATIGETVFDAFSGPLHRYDRSNVLRVELINGALESITELQQLNGGNIAAIENADGAWELIQFQTATLVAEDTWDLSVLLRGQAGTEGAMRDPVAAGARVVLLDSAVRQVAMTAAEVGLAFNWKYGPGNRSLSDAAYSTATHAFAGLGLRPYSPVHLRGKRDHATGDWTLSWIRRTRLGGDSWEGTDAPLGEEAERYTLEILDAPGGDALRTLDLTAPSYLYTAAEQTSDFGDVVWNVPMRVAQVSPSYGAGPATEILTYDF